MFIVDRSTVDMSTVLRMSIKKRIESPGYYISKLMRIHRQDLSRKVSDLGLNCGQVGIVMEFLQNPGSSQDEISSSLGIDKAATARSLASLEKSGFVTRSENKDNRRQKLVYPTEKSIGIEKQLRSILDGSKDKFFKNFTEEEQKEAIDILSRMVDSYTESIAQD